MKPVSRIAFFAALAAVTLMVGFIDYGHHEMSHAWFDIAAVAFLVLPATLGRLQDLEASPWWCVLGFIPLVNFGLNLWLATQPGNLAHQAKQQRMERHAQGRQPTWKPWLYPALGILAVMGYLCMQIKPVTNSEGTAWVQDASGTIHLDDRPSYSQGATTLRGEKPPPPAIAQEAKVDIETKAELATLKAKQEALANELEMTKRTLDQTREKLSHQTSQSTVTTQQEKPAADPFAEGEVRPMTEEQFNTTYDNTVRRISPDYPGLITPGSPMNNAYRIQMQAAESANDPILRDPITGPQVIAKRAADALAAVRTR